MKKCAMFSLVPCLWFCQTAYAESISYVQAEQKILKDSYTSQATGALQEASRLEAEAVRGLGLPQVNLNVRAYAFHSEVDIPLDSFKDNLEKNLSQGVNNKVNQWQNEQNLPPSMADSLKDQLNQSIQSGMNIFPDSKTVTLEDEVVRPSVSVLMPLYTGGLTSTARQIAGIQSERSKITHKQQQDTQRFELIQAYFGVQLQNQLLQSARLNMKSMQTHYSNALKMEQQGFISKGQRMQFEVARNNAERGMQNAESSLNASLFQLNNLLQHSQITELSTPLFINSTHNQSLNTLLKTYRDQSSLIRKMRLDTELASANVKAQGAAKKPTLFAFGEYGLDDKQNWIVGVAASYNLFSGVDKNKKVQAAELQRYAAQLMTERTQQDIENVIYKSYSELETAQHSNLLLQQNMKAAQENLRIQELSFREDMGTATQVLDAQNNLTALRTEQAMNAYKYVISLAALLQGHGSIDQFQSYVSQPDTVYIR